MAESTALTQSDKYFWHRYTGLYESVLNEIEVANILEYGVFHGASIAWLRERYPAGHITGADILPPQQDWPTGEGIRYCQLDQGDDEAILKMLSSFEKPLDLVIEDGSHQPKHQARVLSLTLPYLRPGGLYILEDIHTSHPQHPFGAGLKPGSNTALSVLLALQHLRETDRKLDAAMAARLSSPGFFTPDEVLALDRRIGALYLYRRTSLPLRCYSCGSEDFDYAAYRCKCGVDVFLGVDSMSFLVSRSPAE